MSKEASAFIFDLADTEPCNSPTNIPEPDPGWLRREAAGTERARPRSRKIMEYLARFLIGGAVVSAFAILGDVVRPKSFAGIFGGAPSVALATLALTVHGNGASYAATEARSMIVGALALLVYAWVSSRWMWTGRSTVPTVSGLILWLGLALAGWWALGRLAY